MTHSHKNKWEEVKRKSEEDEIKNTPGVTTEKVVEGGEELSAEAKLECLSYDVLEKKLIEAEKMAEQCRNEALRVQAEAENFRRRTEKDITNAHKYALEKMAFELLVIVDNLERCVDSRVQHVEEELIKNIYVGVELTLKMFLETLQKFEIKQLNPLGGAFNPELHTAMATKEDANVQPNTVLQVMQKGYILKDRLLRPALVVVSK